MFMKMALTREVCKLTMHRCHGIATPGPVSTVWGFAYSETLTRQSLRKDMRC